MKSVRIGVRDQSHNGSSEQPWDHTNNQSLPISSGVKEIPHLWSAYITHSENLPGLSRDIAIRANTWRHHLSLNSCINMDLRSALPDLLEEGDGQIL